MRELLQRYTLPYTSPVPADPRRARLARAGRVAVYVAVAAMLLVPVIRFQFYLQRRIHRLNEHHRLMAAGKIPPGTPAPKGHKGAITRWRVAVEKFWAGGNIYKRFPGKGDLRLHPNMPIVVIGLTPLASLPVLPMTLCFNVLKVLAIVCAILMCARLAGQGRQRTADWVIALGLAWAAVQIVDDMQHGNTNTFVLAAIALHLWLYRRGRDAASGAALAVAVCLKLTPALFLLYWLYQRQWKLLAWTAAAGVLLAVVIPAAVVGPGRYLTLTGTWLNEMILPAVVEGRWYPIHVNQSLSGVISRYFLAGPNGNILWNPDDWIYEWCPWEGWITVAALPDWAARAILRAGQLVVVGFSAWAIGWKKLPRDDGRRMLHYGLVVLAMLLLSQRTWGHHAAILLVAAVATWQAVAMGRMSRRARAWAFGLVLAAGVCLWLTRNDMVKGWALLLGRSENEAEDAANLVSAYGPMCLHFVLLWTAGVILCRALRHSPDPYAARRQKLLS